MSKTYAWGVGTEREVFPVCFSGWATRSPELLGNSVRLGRSVMVARGLEVKALTRSEGSRG